jgi:hypothetical protein
MINRRTFLQNVSFVASAPAFTNLILMSSTAKSAAAAPKDSFKPQPATGNVAFKINGWDRPCENETEDNQVWMNINGSWRTAWR